ncbi:unnamed protein product [Didymodactylos carnosus]|uniref:Uncharacterized protein n=1 Tax=Didymodactylos carnosus TaxID=1234261 RepID=A0A815FBD0_9BILA|nr:unnamed protein product [Didymodactylos carnosus]CAF1323864.1 unnamed protein product [Didymodactylos carnosus]CAF3824113.1 unnamed protein product [Didymodactylos carnosus]CAF4171970.1 unnamed protein product [Didymodactylos carnosus]
MQDSYAEKLDWVLSQVETSLLASNFCTHTILGAAIGGHRPITFDLYCEIYRQLQKNPIDIRLEDENYKIRLLVRNSLSDDRRIQLKNLMKNLSSKMRSDQLWSVVNRFHGKRTNRELKYELK